MISLCSFYIYISQSRSAINQKKQKEKAEEKEEIETPPLCPEIIFYKTGGGALP